MKGREEREKRGRATFSAFVSSSEFKTFQDSKLFREIRENIQVFKDLKHFLMGVVWSILQAKLTQSTHKQSQNLSHISSELNDQPSNPKGSIYQILLCRLMDVRRGQSGSNSTLQWQARESRKIVRRAGRRLKNSTYLRLKRPLSARQCSARAKYKVV